MNTTNLQTLATIVRDIELIRNSLTDIGESAYFRGEHYSAARIETERNALSAALNTLRAIHNVENQENCPNVR